MVHLKQNDTGIGLRITLEDESGAVDLSNTSVLFFMGEYTIQPTIEEAVNGVILVTFLEEHTSVPDIKRAQCQVTYEDGRIEHYPNEGYININIQKGVR